MAANPQPSTFTSLVRRAGVGQALSAPSAGTIYAPTNAAFERLPMSTYRRLVETGLNRAGFAGGSNR